MVGEYETGLSPSSRTGRALLLECVSNLAANEMFKEKGTGKEEGTQKEGMNGRSIGAGGLPRPAYTIQEEGRIVINITVDPKGNVIFAEVGRGTNIDNASMRKSALDAARKAKFNSISGANNQSGTITYVYKFK